jgi:hypothetical protein
MNRFISKMQLHSLHNTGAIQKSAQIDFLMLIEPIQGYLKERYFGHASLQGRRTETEAHRIRANNCPYSAPAAPV